MAIELGKAYVQIVPSAQGIKGSVERVLNSEAASAGESAGRTVGENLAGSMKKSLEASGVDKAVSESLSGAIAKASMLTSVIQTAAAKAKDLATGLVQSGVQYNAQIETYRTALTNMLGDAEKANSMLNNIKRDAARTPFSTDALVATNQYLLSAGENAEYSQKTILALGDAIKATGGGDDELNRMAQNLQQVANVGKASAVDIKQFAFAGINIYQVLADYTGKSVQEVQNMTVTYDVLTKALQAASEEGGRYYNAMGTQSQTLSGRITTLQDNAKQLAGELTTGLSSAYGDLVEKANGWITSVLDSDEKLQQLSTTVTVITSVVAGATGAFVAYKAAMAISEVITAVQNATEGLTAAQVALNIAMDSNPIGAVVAVIGALVGAIGAAYASNEEFRKGWNSAWDSIKSGFSVVADFILDKLNRIIGVANGVANAIAAIGRGENPIDAYNTAYAQTRADFAQEQANKRWNESHAGLEWDDDNGWVKKGTSSSSNGSSKSSGTATSIAPYVDGSSTKKSTGSKTETVIASVSNTVTTSAMNALGAVTTSVQTLQEKVKDASGNIKDRVTTTTTETGKEMVDGVATTYKKVQTVVDGVVTKTTKVYDDMSKTLSGTLTKIAESTFNGITTKIQDVTEKYADGSEHIKRTETETGERIVNGVAETYEKVITYIDGVKDKVTETATAADNSVKGIQSRIEKYLGDASGELDKGVFGLFKSFASDIKNQNWGGLALDVVDLIWGEVSQDQRKTLSNWAADALAAINEAYSGGGLSNAFDAVQAIFGDNGIFKTGDAATNIAGVTNEIKSFGEVINGLAGSGGVGGALGSIVQSFSGMAGGIMSALGSIVSFITANPILATILGVGAVAGGIGLALWAGSQKNKAPVSHYKSPFEDNGVYDSLSEFSTRSAMQYRVTGQRSAADKQTSILERIEGLLDEHLPAIGTGQVVMDSGELVGVISPRMATNVDARIGVVASRKARGV